MQESGVTWLKPHSLAILMIFFWNYLCRIAVPYQCCLRNLRTLAKISEFNIFVRYERLPLHKQMNSTPGSWCMTSEFGRITLATLSILDEIQDGGVQCVRISRTSCVMVSLHYRPPLGLETLPIVCGRNLCSNISNKNLTSVELVNGETLVWNWG